MSENQLRPGTKTSVRAREGGRHSAVRMMWVINGTRAGGDLLVQYWWYLSQAMAAMKWMLARAVMKPWKP